jgi:hypothetical protein
MADLVLEMEWDVHSDYAHQAFFKAPTNSPATGTTIISFWAGLELTSSQLSYLKRKKDKSLRALKVKVLRIIWSPIFIHVMMCPTTCACTTQYYI